jgi:hypothetical protein
MRRTPDVIYITDLSWVMATKTYTQQVIHHCTSCGKPMEVQVNEFRMFGGEIHKTKSEPHCANPACTAFAH